MSSSPVNPDQHTFRSPKFKSVVKEAVEFLTKTPVHPLPPATDFAGVGVYALYYLGSFDHYSQMARQNQQGCRQPIYIGKAVPKGWRKGRTTHSDQDKRLYERLKEHVRSIDSVENLKVPDFSYRFMILKDAETDLISAVESTLIRTCKPLWNTVVDGFGNHDQGQRRDNQSLSEWDVLHPGRHWADRLTGPAPQLEDIIAKIRQGS
ncbi:MAG: Eco29kI family restriction endonuclease [Candidatus Latescibacteria bacterium]|nr:Eco29kI family restriction endonuclease [Candidatus Latescibacterota bacterium]